MKEYEPRGPGQSRTKLIQILQPIDIVRENATYRTRLEKWEKRVKDYVRAGQAMPGEDVRMGVVQNFLAPDELKHHLLVNASKLNTYKELIGEIESYLEAKEGAEAPKPMDVGALTELEANALETAGAKG